jgi:hypothetical protein
VSQEVVKEEVEDDGEDEGDGDLSASSIPE